MSKKKNKSIGNYLGNYWMQTEGSFGVAENGKAQKEKYCTNDKCHHVNIGEDPNAEFCKYCGKELTERLKDIYFDMYLESDQINGFQIMGPEEKEKNKDKGRCRISMKQFIKLFKQYEKELFIEEI